MRKVLLHCGLLMAVAVLILQGPVRSENLPTDKGSRIVSGGFTFSSAGGDLYQWGDDRLTVIQLNHSHSYFIIPGLAVGGEILWEKVSQGTGGYTIWGLGPHITYFIRRGRSSGKVKGTTYPFLGAALFYTNWSSDASGTMISFRIGALHMLSSAVGLSGEASYDIENVDPGYGDSISGNVFSLGAGFTIFLN